MALILQYRHRLVEVVMLHGRRAVEDGQWRGALHHERVRLAAVIEIVTQTRHKHAESLQCVELRCRGWQVTRRAIFVVT